MPKKSFYQELGVDAGKKGVRSAFSRVINNDFPGAFVNIVKDPGRDDWVITQHPDGDGSKLVQRLLHYYETGEIEIFEGMVDDALSMNSADIAASGFVYGYWLLTDILNVGLIKGVKEVVMNAIACRMQELLSLYRSFGIKPVFFLGGETADLPDQVMSAVFDITITAHMEEKFVIRGNVAPGDVIYGLASNGQAIWENVPNFGLMANGLTLARSSLMSATYNSRYPNLSRRNIDFYKGRFKVGDKIRELGDAEISSAILSPTRQWAIFIRILLDELERQGARDLIKGISVNTGGGATKICHVGTGGIRYVKRMPSPPAIFQLIKSESEEIWRNMFETFNCGVGLDIIASPDKGFKLCLEEVAKKCKIELYNFGFCEATNGSNEVVLETDYGTFSDY